jgi:hypothetical protein
MAARTEMPKRKYISGLHAARAADEFARREPVKWVLADRRLRWWIDDGVLSRIASTRSFGSQTRTSRRQGELMFEKNILGKASHIKQRMS